MEADLYEAAQESPEATPLGRLVPDAAARTALRRRVRSLGAVRGQRADLHRAWMWRAAAQGDSARMAWLIDQQALLPGAGNWFATLRELPRLPNPGELAQRVLAHLTEQRSGAVTGLAQPLGDLAATLPRGERRALIAAYDACLQHVLAGSAPSGEVQQHASAEMRARAAGRKEPAWELQTLPRRVWRTCTWPVRRVRERRQAEAELQEALGEKTPYRASPYRRAFQWAAHAKADACMARCCAALLAEADSEVFLKIWSDYGRAPRDPAWRDALAAAALEHMAKARRDKVQGAYLARFGGPEPLAPNSAAVDAGLAGFAAQGQTQALLALVQRGYFGETDLEAGLAAPPDASVL